MAVRNAQVVDLQAYRAARRQSLLTEQKKEMPFAVVQPMVMMVPVWAFFPMVPGAWVYAN